MHGDDYTELCGVDKNQVPERTQRWADGRIRKGGWRRVLKILVQRKLIDKRYAQKVFNTYLNYSIFDKVKMFNDPLAKRLDKMRHRSVEKFLSKTSKFVPQALDVDELMSYRDEKKRLQIQGEIL